jgi:hypothetical protein
MLRVAVCSNILEVYLSFYFKIPVLGNDYVTYYR